MKLDLFSYMLFSRAKEMESTNTFDIIVVMNRATGLSEYRVSPVITSLISSRSPSTSTFDENVSTSGSFYFLDFLLHQLITRITMRIEVLSPSSEYIASLKHFLTLFDR